MTKIMKWIYHYTSGLANSGRHAMGSSYSSTCPAWPQRDNMQAHPTQKDTKTGNVGGWTLLFAPQKSGGKERKHSLPLPPPLSCILPSTSLLMTNKHSGR
ncbi:hypothetical protein XENORESO_014695 [Xenotaenia resolanae]|uniref:Uncharacterized protein n=1 Tax=Xenotaenia resolanae TaxID=208358 RepID=A0ABV0W3Z9_9TELE